MTVGLRLAVGCLCLCLAVYFMMLARTGVALIRSGTPAAVALGVGVLLLPVLGAWAVVATLRAGVAHQRLARLARLQGAELDVSGLPRRPSGGIRRDAADALSAELNAEVETDPGDWRRWYRLSRAYDFAGDRSRARDAMRRAVALQAEAP